jgi:hypothetical protein
MVRGRDHPHGLNGILKGGLAQFRKVVVAAEVAIEQRGVNEQA